MRPDEIASEDEAERNKRLEGRIGGSLKSAAKIGIGGLGIGLGSKIAPFLSELIPVDLAMKGINKLAPKVGQFLKKGQEMGLNLKEGLDFLKKNMGKKEPEKKELAKESGGKTESYFTQAFQFLKSGKSVERADPFLKYAKQFVDSGKIKDVEDLKTLYDMFKQQQSGQQKKGSTGLSQGLQEQFNQGYGTQGQAKPQQPRQQQAQPQQAAGPGQQALMAILQKINQGKGQP
jgi:hypothetical protein